MRVLVTGATGWLGTTVVSVVGQHYWVRATDRVVVPAPERGESVVCDLGDWDSVRSVVDGIDAIVHVATSKNADDPGDLVHGSAGATANLFEAAVRAGIRRVVLMSSSAVVAGHPRETWIDADTPPRFRSLYGMSKWLQEEVARYYVAEYDVTAPILRPWSIVDADQRAERTGTRLEDMGEPYAHGGVFGWIDRRDVADACLRALTADLSGAPVLFLMANPLGRELMDVQTAEAALDWHPIYDFAADIPDGLERITPQKLH